MWQPGNCLGEKQEAFRSDMSVFSAGMSGVNQRLAVAFLRKLGDPPWRLVAAGGVRLFNDRSLPQMADWIAKHQHGGRGVFALAPKLADGHQWIAARLPLSSSPATLTPVPQLIIAGDDFTCLWRLIEPVSEERARGLSRRLVAGIKGAHDAVGSPVPLPGTIMLRQVGARMAKRFPVNIMPPARAPAYHLVGDELRGADAPAGEVDDFARADQLSAAPLRWLWPGVLPAGEFALLAGPPKIGKSQIAVDLAARLTNGAAWPDGTSGATPGGVILIECEDPLAVTQGRLRAAGAVMGRVMLSNVSRDLSQPDGVSLVERQRATLKGAGLLVLSPVRLFFGDIESSRQVDLRRRLAPLLAWASAHGVAVLGIAHRESGKGGRSAEDVAGPRVFAQRARTVLSTLIDPADRLAKSNPNAARRLLTTAGSNLASDALEIPYRIIRVADSSRVAYEATVRLGGNP
jgi:hypothetical protein